MDRLVVHVTTALFLCCHTRWRF